MIHKVFNSEDDLFAMLNAPDFEPVRYRHVKRGTEYTVVSDNEYRLHEFSEEGSMHDVYIGGVLVQAELQFSGEGKYGGAITIYVGDDRKFWARPRYEFFDGRFIKVEKDT